MFERIILPKKPPAWPAKICDDSDPAAIPRLQNLCQPEAGSGNCAAPKDRLPTPVSPVSVGDKGESTNCQRQSQGLPGRCTEKLALRPENPPCSHSEDVAGGSGPASAACSIASHFQNGHFIVIILFLCCQYIFQGSLSFSLQIVPSSGPDGYLQTFRLQALSWTQWDLEVSLLGSR